LLRAVFEKEDGELQEEEVLDEGVPQLAGDAQQQLFEGVGVLAVYAVFLFSLLADL
jgi:hypothetical protein